MNMKDTAQGLCTTFCKDCFNELCTFCCATKFSIKEMKRIDVKGRDGGKEL